MHEGFAWEGGRNALFLSWLHLVLFVATYEKGVFALHLLGSSLVSTWFPLGSTLLHLTIQVFFQRICLVPDLVPLGSIQFLTSTKTDVLHRSDAKNQCSAARYQSALYVTLVFVSVFYFYV